MNYLRYPLLALCLVAIANCSEDGPTTPTGQGDLLLATQTIDGGGGTLEADGFLLTVPSGSFNASTEMKLFSEPDTRPFGEDVASGTFRIENLPYDFSQPLRIAVRQQRALAHDSYIAVGEDVHIQSLEEITTSFCLFAAADSAGWLVMHLPVPEDLNPPEGKDTRSADLSRVARVQGLTDFRYHETSEGHFTILGSARTSTLEQRQQMGDDFENAYQVFFDRGFSYEARTDWPIHIIVKETADLDDGTFSSMATTPPRNLGQPWVHCHGANSRSFDRPRPIVVTVGHEFLHLVQYLYDSRSWYDKTHYATRHSWLNEATAVWCEELFVDDPLNYVSASFMHNEYAAFRGMHKTGEGANRHGYGLAPVIKYLREHYLSSRLVNIYENIRNWHHPLAALAYQSAYPRYWYPACLRELILGNLYNVAPELWIDNVPESSTFIISGAENTQKEYRIPMPDCSAILFDVQLAYPEIDPIAQITFSLPVYWEVDTEISVFKYNSLNQIELIGFATDKVTVPGVKLLMDDGWDLLALVSYSEAEAPYDTGEDVEFEIEVSQDLTPASCYIAVRDIDATFTTEFPDGSTDVWEGTHSVAFPIEPGAEVTNNGNTFVQQHNYVGNDGRHYIGNTVVVFASDMSYVDSFAAEAWITDDDWVRAWSVTGGRIYVEPGSGNRVFQIAGTVVCSRIEEMMWSKTYPDEYTDRLNPGWTCNGESEIEIIVNFR